MYRDGCGQTVRQRAREEVPMSSFDEVEESSSSQPSDSLIRREAGSSAITTAVGKSGAQTTNRDRGHGSTATRAYISLRL